MEALAFTDLMTALTTLIGQVTEVTVFVFAQITTVFSKVVTTPLLLIPVGLMVTGALFGFASRLMSVARGR